MDELISNLKNTLSISGPGLTVNQLRRKYRTIAGCDIQYGDYESIPKLLESLPEIVRFERSAWGDTLYFLQSDDAMDPSVANVKNDSGKLITSKNIYNVDEELDQLHADDRGWYTICWNTLPGDTESSIRRRYSLFGHVAEVRLDKGKTFVRYLSRSFAEDAIRQYGLLHHIEASRQPKIDQGGKDNQNEDPEVNQASRLLPKENHTKDQESSTVQCSDNSAMDLNDELQLLSLTLNEDDSKPNLEDARDLYLAPLDTLPAISESRCKHASLPCKNYPKCRPNCDFQHPLCPLGTFCHDRFCSYDHLHRAKKCHLCLKEKEEGIASLRFVTTECEHRRTACAGFPNCDYGVKCSFLHPTCPDNACDDLEKCPYEHPRQRKVCFICLKLMRSNQERTTNGAASRSGGLETTARSGQPDMVIIKKDMPCRYDVKCWTPQCPYKHPPEWSKKACPWGQRCRREKCTFIHPPLVS